ncbi:MAG TPA: hypothetical protein VHN77_04700 [Phycisphaerales bacterium]|nr:hypothetical protein [Phycisphaerales bacterium]
MRALALFALASLTAQALAQPVSTSFTFQGVVTEGGTPANATYDMKFRLYDASSAGSQVGPALCTDNLTVTGGTFSVQLDFGSTAFAGSKRFIEMSIRPDTGLDCSSSAGFTTLDPRQEVTATPYAQHALGAATASVATTALSASSFGGQPSSFYTNAGNLASGTLADTRLSTNIPRANTANAFSARQSITSSLSTDPEALLVTLNNNNTSQAVKGVATGGSATVHGGLFEASNSPAGVGVLGQALANSGSTRGVWGKVNSASGWAGYFEGRGFFSGNVGIGSAITTPLAPLHVQEGSAGAVTPSGSASAVFERNALNYVQILSPDASERGIMLGSPAHGAQAGIYYTNGQNMNFRTGGNSTKMRITDAGDVGIGVASPAARLHVGGSLLVDGAITMPATTRVLSIPSTAFTVVSSFTDFFNSTTGLRTWDAGILGQYVAPVLLPDGAVITSVTMFVNDSSADDASVFLQRIDLTTGSAVVKATCTSSGTASGIRSFTDATVSNPDVDNSLFSYSLFADLRGQAAGSTLSLRAVQVHYQITTPLP